MGFSDTVASLVDRLKPSNKSAPFSGIGSGNQGVVSFEDNVGFSYLCVDDAPATINCGSSTNVFFFADGHFQTHDCPPSLPNIPRLHRHGLFRKRCKFPSQVESWPMYVPLQLHDVPHMNLL
jgi:hypothetical protein